MATTKKKPLVIGALVTRPRDLPAKLHAKKVQPRINTALTFLSRVLAEDPPPDVLSQLHIDIKDWATALEAFSKLARERLLTVLKERGQEVGEKGTRQATVAGWVLEARRTRTGIDAKTLEAALRAKGMEPGRYMQSRVTYAVDEQGLQDLLEAGHFTPDELDALKPEPTYALQAPRRAEDDE